MKRLLLSTTLILVTLTGVKGADALNLRESENTASAAAVAPIDVNAELKNAFANQTSRHQKTILTNLEGALSTSDIHTSLVTSRRQDFETIAKAYIDSIIDYSPNSLASVFTVNTLALATMLAIVYEYLLKTENNPKDRLVITPPMGGGSTLATSTICITGVYSLIRDYALFWGYNYFNLGIYIAKLWTPIYYFLALLFENDNYYLYTLNQKLKGKLSNPEVKSYFIKVLSIGWVLKNRAASPKEIKTALRNAMLANQELGGVLHKALGLPDSPPLAPR